MSNLALNTAIINRIERAARENPDKNFFEVLQMVGVVELETVEFSDVICGDPYEDFYKNFSKETSEQTFNRINK